MKLVRFTQHNSPYNSGEVAGFEDEAASALVRKGVAQECDSQGNVTAQTSAGPVEGEVKEVSEAEFREALGRKTKANLVAIGKKDHALALSESSTKDELVEAIVAAAVASAKAESGTAEAVVDAGRDAAAGQEQGT